MASSTSNQQREVPMKKLALIVALLITAGSAQAATYVDGRNRVVVPDGCASWSCMSVSIPGHFSHNVKPQRRVHRARNR
jgi:hypothetical protein